MQGTYLFVVVVGPNLLGSCDARGWLPFCHGKALIRGVRKRLRGRRLLPGVTWQGQMPCPVFLLSYSDTVVSLLVYCPCLPLLLIHSGFLRRNSLLSLFIACHQFILAASPVFGLKSHLCMCAWKGTTLSLESIATSLLEKLKDLRRLGTQLLCFLRMIWS